MQAHWGKHHFKTQKQWNHNVAKAVASILDEDVVSEITSNSDVRPKLVDKLSGKHILIDTGASRSVWSRLDFPDCPIDPFKALKAVNSSTISTFGLKTIKIQVSDDYAFSHDFVLADLSQAVLGWDYLAAAKLNVVWNGNKCYLMKGDKIKAQLRMSNTSSEILSLAPISLTR